MQAAGSAGIWLLNYSTVGILLKQSTVRLLKCPTLAQWHVADTICILACPWSSACSVYSVSTWLALCFPRLLVVGSVVNSGTSSSWSLHAYLTRYSLGVPSVRLGGSAQSVLLSMHLALHFASEASTGPACTTFVLPIVRVLLAHVLWACLVTCSTWLTHSLPSQLTPNRHNFLLTSPLPSCILS